MNLLTYIKPCATLQDFVRRYEIFKFVYDKDVLPPVKFHTPRPEHSMTFYVRDAQKFSYINTETIVTYPLCIINGIYTVPLYRYGANDFWAIKVVFQPSSLSQLKLLPVKEITNTFINAEEVLKTEISFTMEQLCTMNELCDMIETIEGFLIHLMKKAAPPQPIDKAISYLLQQEGTSSLDWLANQSYLCVRQFIRKFEEQVGISPKEFQKIIRFDRAFRMKNNHPHLNWLTIAFNCGYYDYQHLVKDFKTFTNLTPPAFYELEKKAPGRSLGLFEG